MDARSDIDVDAVVRRVQGEPARRGELVTLLAEEAPLYDGRSAAAASWIRGWLMAKFAEVGLPSEALPAVLEVLHNDQDPRSHAAAAVATRGVAAPDPQIVAALLSALRSLRGRDESVELHTPKPAPAASGSATAACEVLAAMRWQPAADAHTADVLDEIDREWPGAWSRRTQRAFAQTVASCRRRRPATLTLLPSSDSAAVSHP